MSSIHTMSVMKTKGKTANWTYNCKRRHSIPKPGTLIHIGDHHLLKDAFNEGFYNLPRESGHSKDEGKNTNSRPYQ